MYCLYCPTKVNIDPKLCSAFPPYSVVYNFKCHYDADYLDRTGQRLEASIIQHKPAIIRNGNLDNLHTCLNLSWSVISEHLLKKKKLPMCQIINRDMFTVLKKVHFEFHIMGSVSLY